MLRAVKDEVLEKLKSKKTSPERLIESVGKAVKNKIKQNSETNPTKNAVGETSSNQKNHL